MKILCVAMTLLLFRTQAVVAQNVEVIEVSDSAEIAGQNPSVVRQKLIKDLINKSAWKIIEDYLGKPKSDALRNSIQRKVVDNSSKYVLTTKNAEDSGKGDLVGVSALISVSNLRDMLEDQGFVQSTEGPASVLPVIAFVDRVGGVEERWWAPATDDRVGIARGLSQPLLDELQKSLLRSGFYLERPEEWRLHLLLPPELRKESLSTSDYPRLQERLGAQVVVKGQVLLEQGRVGGVKLSVQLSAINAASGRVVAEVSQASELSGVPASSAADRERYSRDVRSAAQELASQLSDAWAKGSFSTRSLLLVIRGKLNPNQLEKVKQALSRVRSIRNLRERFFERESFGFEMDASAAPETFVEQLKGVQGDGFSLKLVESSATGFVLDAQVIR